MSAIHAWLLEKSDSNIFLFIKRLSANDTGATGGHQTGIYIPAGVADPLFPSISQVEVLNPSLFIHAHVSSHDYPDKQARVIYYNNHIIGKTRNEKRITRWGVGSPLQNPENTGALSVWAFACRPGEDSRYVDIWVCQSAAEEEVIESALGEILPGALIFGTADQILGGFAPTMAAVKRHYELPPAWQQVFPAGSEIIRYAANHYSAHSRDPDKQLMERRRIEYEIFLLVESMHVLERVRGGFTSVDDFIALANSVSNRRKSRAGRSLELHLEQLFTEHGLLCFATQAITEGNKRPDFLFPSAAAYHDERYPAGQLRMLAVKTTCKDRWRQVLNEADRIKEVFLFTLQEGVSLAQFREMQQSGVRLVVPTALHKKYPEEVRAHLISLGEFINQLKKLYRDKPDISGW